MSIISLGIAGCLGRMGSELVKKILLDNRVKLSGGFEHSTHPSLGKKISDIVNCKSNLIVSSNAKEVFKNSNVIIDFTVPEATSHNIDLALNTSTPIVIGTTGLNGKIISQISNASKSIPILQSSNMSLGVNLLFQLVHKTAASLNEKSYDIEIAETHHKHKIDAPSGTALSLGEFASKGRNKKFEKVGVFDRSRISKKRKIGDIGFAVTRGGEIAGEHTVSFIGENDRLDLTHKAFNRSIFVNGAIESAIFLAQQKAGLYSMKDLITFIS